MKKIVVIGMSAASLSFVVKVRTFDKESEIICFSGEEQMPYNRCLLADLLTGQSQLQDIMLKPDEFFKLNNITIRLSSWVTKIDTQVKSVWVSDQEVSYDTLFLGTGTAPIIPAFARNHNANGLFNFHMATDIEKIKCYIQDNSVKTALVIGAGLNGIEVVSSLVDLGISVGLIEASSSVLPGQVDPSVASWLHNKMQDKGVTLLTGRKALAIESSSGKVQAIKIDTGSSITTDLVVLAVGSMPHTALTQGTDIATQDGLIMVDKYMQSSAPGVFAAGDACMVPDMISGAPVRSTTWSDAMLQGLCAATSLSSQPRPYGGAIGLRDSHFFGLDFYAVGKTTDGSLEIRPALLDLNAKSIKKIYMQDGVVKGFVLIGDLSDLADLKRIYVTRQQISPEAVLN